MRKEIEKFIESLPRIKEMIESDDPMKTTLCASMLLADFEAIEELAGENQRLTERVKELERAVIKNHFKK